MQLCSPVACPVQKKAAARGKNAALEDLSSKHVRSCLFLAVCAMQQILTAEGKMAALLQTGAAAVRAAQHWQIA